VKLSVLASVLFLGSTALCPALAGEVAPRNPMFTTPGTPPPVYQPLEAKRNARCTAIYGPGFMALGDSDTCVRIGGRVGFEAGTSFKHNQLMLVPPPALGAPGPAPAGVPVGVVRTPRTGTAAQAEIRVDTRTPTEMGDLATHVRVRGVSASGALRGPDYVR
jgi:Porin subfamily